MDINDILNTKDETASMDAQDMEKNKVFAILAYIGFLVLVPIFAAKDSKFAQYHANQGLTLLLCEVAVGAVIFICHFIPVVKIIVGILGGLVEFVFFLMIVFGIINAVQGKAKELPLIGKYTFLK